MKLMLLLLHLVSFASFGQGDTCIFIETDYKSGTETTCGKLDQFGNWKGRVEILYQTGMFPRSSRLTIVRLKNWQKKGKELCFYKPSSSDAYVQTEKSHYRKGKRVGKMTRWTRYGELTRDGRYRNDREVGRWHIFDTLGNVARLTRRVGRNRTITKNFSMGELCSRVEVVYNPSTRDYAKSEKYYDRQGNLVSREVSNKVWYEH
ncbi:MAG: antitoxin component YwqK of YwqJK toxin-antitoxin module [Flavobacteriaceae bacterium]|jgi:antitoxin component YwqK of YwqJK toxin-antitoxin module